MRLLTLFVYGCVSSTAWADPGLRVEAGFGTELPLSVGPYVQFESPQRLRARLGVGWMPSPYLGMINDISVGAGWYDETTAALIDASLANALVLHPSVGWRPFAEAGFHVGVGYQVAALGGSLTGVEVVEAALGEAFTRDEADAAVVLNAAAVDHMLTAQLGWEWLLSDRWVLDVGLGGAFTVGASARLEEEIAVERPFADRALEPLLEGGEAYLVDVLTRYVHTPSIRVGFGYRF